MEHFYFLDMQWDGNLRQFINLANDAKLLSSVWCGCLLFIYCEPKIRNTFETERKFPGVLLCNKSCTFLTNFDSVQINAVMYFM